MTECQDEAIQRASRRSALCSAALRNIITTTSPSRNRLSGFKLAAQIPPGVVNPLVCRGNYSDKSNDMKLVHWPLIGGLLHLVQRGEDWAEPQPAKAPHLFVESLKYFFNRGMSQKSKI